jgi:peroxiredoxin
MLNKLQLGPGDTAPLFAVSDIRGNKIELKKYRGSLVWIIFYRYPGCPACNLHLNSVQNRYQDLKQNHVEVIAVFESPKESFANATLNGRPLPDFPLIADPNRDLYRLYGVNRSLFGFVSLKSTVELISSLWRGGRQRKITGNLLQMPADFFVGPKGVLDFCYYGRSLGDHPKWTLLDEWIKMNHSYTWNSK